MTTKAFLGKTTTITRGRPRTLTDAQRAENKKRQQDQRRAERQALGLNTLTGRPVISRTGSIYLAECQGMYKIGYSNEMYDRRMKLQVNNPFSVSIVYTSDDIQGVNFVEAALHKKYADKCVRGEWFKLNKTNVKHIKTAVNKVSGADYTFEL